MRSKVLLRSCLLRVLRASVVNNLGWGEGDFRFSKAVRRSKSPSPPALSRRTGRGGRGAPSSRHVKLLQRRLINRQPEPRRILVQINEPVLRLRFPVEDVPEQL